MIKNTMGTAKIVVTGTEPKDKKLLIFLTMTPTKEGDEYIIDSYFQWRPAKQQEACLDFFKRTLNMVDSVLTGEEIENPSLSKTEITAGLTKDGKTPFKLTVSAVMEEDGIQFKSQIHKNKSSLEKNLQLFIDVICMAWDVLESEEWQ